MQPSLILQSNMAKSKSGGTRSYIRGRVGADVYSIGKDSKGKKQQVVRSLAETVANPQTTAQMRGRMIMSTIMQAKAALSAIIDHSFDNVSGVQPNLSEFISRNYALIKADVAAHPASGNAFGLVLYGEKGAKQGAYIVSDGKAAFPAAITFVQGTGVMSIAVDAEALTVGALKTAWEVGTEGYLTIVGITTGGSADYARLHLNASLSDDTVITSENIETVFNISGNASPVLAVNGMTITATLASIAGCSSVIVTRKTTSGFIHSKAVLGASVDLPYNANAALPSYPTGSEKFLNGGSVEGGSAPVNPSPAPSPTPDVPTDVDAHLTTFTVGGQNCLSGSLNVTAGTGKAIAGVLADRQDGKAYALVRKTGAAYTIGETASDSAVTISGTSLSTTFDLAQNETWRFALTEDGVVIQVLGSVVGTEGGDDY